jgi:hypothetical protein
LIQLLELVSVDLTWIYDIESQDLCFAEEIGNVVLGARIDRRSSCTFAEI